MAVAIVDRLEVVNINAQHTPVLAAEACLFCTPLCFVEKSPTVGNAGESIESRQIRGALACALQVPDAQRRKEPESGRHQEGNDEREEYMHVIIGYVDDEA